MKFLFILLFSLTTFSVFSQYDINDPRNPDCPCHKYQKLADEEYKNLLAKANRKDLKENEAISEILRKNVQLKETENDKKNHSNIKKKKNRLHFMGFKNSGKHKSKRRGALTNSFHFLKRKKKSDSCFFW